jgi:Tfp pilus assembly protein PilF
MSTISPKAAKLEAALQEAILHHQAGRLSEAERLYRRILRDRPSHLGANTALGMALKDQGKLDEAAAAFQRVVAVAPDHAAGHNNFGNILWQQGKLKEAETSYRRALALSPDMVDALKNLGLVIVNSGRFAESFAPFRRHAELAYGKAENSARGSEQTPPHKVRHDEEQRDYLKGGKPVGDGAAAKFHLEEGARMTGRAVNRDNSCGDIAARWQSSSPQIAVIDDFLANEALDGIRRYCWRSTIWHQAFPNGYLGAMPEHGFACPLIAQIADELRSTYPAIMGDHPLLRWWGFKYDSRLRGINVHADFAAVNVNFWITPDEANLDPECGGLVIWDTPAPLDWGFNQYNSPSAGPRIREFLARTGAKSITVPYRANRAVIFDSDLFHETDRITFKEGYLNRRINITMLYGSRESGTKRT